MNPVDNNTQSRHNLFCRQPISCPWINFQPYPSTVNKNKSGPSTSSKPVVSMTIILNLTSNMKWRVSIQQYEFKDGPI